MGRGTANDFSELLTRSRSHTQVDMRVPLRGLTMLRRRARRIRYLDGILGFHDAAATMAVRPSSNLRQRTARRGADATARG